MTRRIAPIDPRDAAGALALGRCVWIDVPVGEPPEERPLDAADHDADHLHLRLTDCRVGEAGLEHQRVDLLLEERLMVTVHRGPSRLADDLRHHIANDFARHARSPGFLPYQVGARLIDAYRAAQCHLEERLGRLQARLAASDPGAIAAIPALDAELLGFRRAVIGARDTLSELGGRRSALICDHTRPYLAAQAVALDRLQRDALGSREILSSTLGLNIAATSGRAARALGRLSALTAVFLPMLFAVQVVKAGLDWSSPWSALWALGLVNATAVVLYMRRHRLL